jgi:hypothetical protein
VRSSAVPSGLGSISHFYPALTRWANECRRFAAGIGRWIHLFPEFVHSDAFIVQFLAGKNLGDAFSVPF